jgi:hypothetical protein
MPANPHRAAWLLKHIVLIFALSTVPASADDSWQFRLTPYLWFAGLKGDLATIPGSPPASIDISPSQAIEDTEVGLMLLFDAKRGRHGVFADFLYTDVRSDEDLLPPPIALTLRSVSKTTILSLAYQYELHNEDRAVVDLIVGGRYWDIDTELKFGSGTGGPLDGRKLTNDESWIDPMVGIKGRMPLGDTAFYAQGGAVIGGFNVGSDLFYELSGAIGYQWTPAIGTAIGYRMFDVDYEDGGFVYDARQEGWQVGLTWAF